MLSGLKVELEVCLGVMWTLCIVLTPCHVSEPETGVLMGLPGSWRM